ncbi:MAG TPA: ABC transporter ATP-binding protein [Anaerolineae bacterium]|nr:ABC transporter ATP-binding protein [Anaerolineae bacterium]
MSVDSRLDVFVLLAIYIRKQLEGFTLDLKLEAPEEKIIVLFGPSGAGKSLTLAAIAGFMTPDAGQIAVGGRVLFDAARGIDLSPQARHIGMVRQDLALFPHMSAADNIAYGLSRLPPAERTRRIHELINMTHLDGLESHKPSELSGGQQQRVALARALANEPTLLLLDEPFSALDQAIRLELRHELLALQKRLRTNMLFVTHDLGEANLLADVMAVMDKGRVIQFDAPETILREPATRRVAEIVGVANILPATILDNNTLCVGERELRMDLTRLDVGADVFLCIRPERITLVRRDFDSRIMPNVIEGDLIGEESDGSNVVLQFRAGEPRLNPRADFDLQIDLPEYVYERLNLARERHWLVSIKPHVMHLVPA